MKTYSTITLIALLLTGLMCCEDSTKSTVDAETRETTSESVSNPASASGNATGGVPKITFSDTLHEFGVITAGVKVAYTFEFTNTGTAPLLIEDASASCGCTLPKYVKGPYKPGEKGNIEVVFDSGGKSGMTKKEVFLTTNAVPAKQILYISADIQPN